ncbi:hypothetical protein JHK82_035353 [Glycine max]|nr:hypothetical protein JHK82_035353 [Glycine max]KAG5129370.1 hypothetical protein JHK84_035767 [Glycine max]
MRITPSSLYPPTTLSRAIASLEKDSRAPYLASNNTSEDLPQSLRSPFLSSHHHSAPIVRSDALVACRDSPFLRDQIKFVTKANPKEEVNVVSTKSGRPMEKFKKKKKKPLHHQKKKALTEESQEVLTPP